MDCLPMRRLFLATALAAMLPLAAPLAGAQSFSTLEERMTATEFREAGLEKLTPEELAILNAWLKSRATASPNNTTTPANDRRGFASEGFFGSGDGADQITSMIIGPFRGWEGVNTMITLANGQVWRVTDSSTRLRVNLTDPRVTLTRNALGGWSLRVEGYNTRARVIRVK